MPPKRSERITPKSNNVNNVKELTDTLLKFKPGYTTPKNSPSIDHQHNISNKIKPSVHDMFSELMSGMSNINLKLDTVVNDISSIKVDIDTLKKENYILKEENKLKSEEIDTLSRKIKSLHNSFYNGKIMVKSSANLCNKNEFNHATLTDKMAELLKLDRSICDRFDYMKVGPDINKIMVTVPMDTVGLVFSAYRKHKPANVKINEYLSSENFKLIQTIKRINSEKNLNRSIFSFRGEIYYGKPDGGRVKIGSVDEFLKTIPR